MSLASNDTTQDLTLDRIPTASTSADQTTTRRLQERVHGSKRASAHSPPASDAASPDSRRSVLSLDDLSNESKREDNDNDGDSQGSERPGANTKRVEHKLQRNLRKQQEHYARQRKLFEDLRSDPTAAAAPSGAFSQSSSQSSDSDHHASENSDSNRKLDRQQRERHHSHREDNSATRFQLELERELTGISLKRQATTSATGSSSAKSTPFHSCPRRKAPDYRDEQDVLSELSRIKAKAVADYQRRMVETQQSQANRMRTIATPAPPRPPSTKLRPEFVEELSQQEASNEALRKQLELLRRLQVENNRFRQETRAAREQNEVLEAQNQLQKREIQRLREDVKELAVKIEHDQQSLVAAAQTSRKLKHCQKQLHAAQRDAEKLRNALQDALEHQEQIQAKALGDVSELTVETKRLKRSLKQIKQQEAKVVEDNELLKSTVDALESELVELKTELHDHKRVNSELSIQVVEKTSQCDAIESSATACVQRLETGMEALQKAFDAERDKRKKGEAQQSSFQARVGDLEIELAHKTQQADKAERHIAQLQERLKERKLALQQQKHQDDEKIEELLSKQRQDLKAIASLRVDCESLEQQLGSERVAAQSVAKSIATETRGIRKEIEGLRRYIETSIQGTTSPATPDDDGGSEMDDEHAANPPGLQHNATANKYRHDEIGSQRPELQFLQGAASALRTEMMDFVHEFQRSKHALRQLGKKLALAHERVSELERLRGDDARKIKDLREQRVVSEQAREITSEEKLEVLKWSQQTCEKNEALEEELQKYDRFFQSLLHKLKQRRRGDSGNEEENDHHHGAARHRSKDDIKKTPGPSKHQGLSQNFKSLEFGIDAILSTQQELSQELEQTAQERDEQQDESRKLQCELEAKTLEFEHMMAEVEALHAKNAKEQKLHMEAIVVELESEKRELADNLRAGNARIEVLAGEKKELEARVEGFEQDLPVLATIVRLFVLVVQPLILQVSELLSQKRYLLRENAEYAHSQEEIECIGQVLKELVPMNANAMVNQINAAEKLRHKRFRRVVVAVFALNRFQKCGFVHQQSSSDTNVGGEDDTHSSSTSGTFGVCTSLKPPKKKRGDGKGFAASSSSSLLHRSSPPTVIKVLPPRQTLANLNLRQLLERLKHSGITEKVADAIELASSSSSSSSILPTVGSLLVQVIAAIDPGAKEVLLENTRGAFHCQALLERTRRSQRYRQSHHNDDSAAKSLDSELSTVDLIRKRILALGKRVEDLHYQRNALQKDNYEFQFQLEQQATHLKQMDVLIHKTQELEYEMQDMQARSEQAQQLAQEELDTKQGELHAKEAEMQAKEQELVRADATIRALERDIAGFQEKLGGLEAEKKELQAQVTTLQQYSLDEEEKAEIAKTGVKKQEEEVRNLKQAAKKAHELYQKTSWQLEQEIMERANLQVSVDTLKRQKESLEKELHDAKLRDLEKSFEGDSQEVAAANRPKQHVRFAASSSASLRDNGQIPSSSSSSPSRKGSSNNGRKEQEMPSLMLEDTCLYHKYEKPSPTKRPSGTAESEENDDEGSDGKSDLQSSSHSPRFRLQLSPRGSANDANSKFLDEWRRLQISSAFDDDTDRSTAHKTEPSRPRSSVKSATASTNVASNAGKAASKQIAREVEIQSNRRRIEIDKVNSAVHDYMDRIDEKLQQMYGIPPSSSSRLRTGGKQGGGDEEDASSFDRESEMAKDVAVRRRNHVDARRASKANDLRPTHLYG